MIALRVEMRAPSQLSDERDHINGEAHHSGMDGVAPIGSEVRPYQREVRPQGFLGGSQEHGRPHGDISALGVKAVYFVLDLV
jgi:hypothetical protein